MKDNWKIKGKKYTSKKTILQNEDHCKIRRDYRIKEVIKIENSH